jgi:uncharacterized protein (DUF983 family)
MPIEVPQKRALPESAEGSTSRHVPEALMRGMKQRCPACGGDGLYRSYLKIVDHCRHCGEALHHHRADDAPPYFTILVVGHIIVGGVLTLEQMLAPADWVQAAIWLPMTLILSLLLLPRVKGALVGLQWALRMHGFGSAPDPADPEPLPDASAPSIGTARGSIQ